MEPQVQCTKSCTIVTTSHQTYPFAVLVDSDRYAGPAFIADRPHCIPIPPIPFEWDTGVNKLSRQQLPLQMRYAFTTHKCQGQTLQKAVIDIGKSELAAGCTFVAISRLPRLQPHHAHIAKAELTWQATCTPVTARGERVYIHSSFPHLGPVYVCANLELRTKNNYLSRLSWPRGSAFSRNMIISPPQPAPTRP